jgi:serine/threonine protein kinase
LEFVVRSGGRQLARVVLKPGQYWIGHERGNDISLDDPSVSARHALLTVVSEEEIYLHDMGSANGTVVDGQPCDQPVRVEFESMVQLGNSSVLLQRAGLPAAVFAHAPEGLLSPRTYEWGEPLVRGGISTIHDAHDLSLGRRVAIRVMQAASQLSARTVLRFVREAQIMAQLQHPQIPPVYELKRSGQGQLYYTTRAIDGHSLATIVDRLRNQDAESLARWPLAALLTVFQKAADAIAYAHFRGVAHCALRPDNIIAGHHGEVLVIGWTFARLFSEGMDPVLPEWQVRAAGEPIASGLSAYTAPEQAVGTGVFDERADVYSLAAVLYTLLSLAPPYPELAEGALEERIVAGLVPPLHSPEGTPPIHAELVQVVTQALSSSPERRPATVQELQAQVADAGRAADTGTKKWGWGIF